MMAVDRDATDPDHVSESRGRVARPHKEAGVPFHDRKPDSVTMPPRTSTAPKKKALPRLAEGEGKTLVITEKPSVARDITKALGGFQNEKNFFEGSHHVVTSAVGHMLELVAPEGVEVQRGKWALANLPVIPDHFELKPIQQNESRHQRLRRRPRRRVDLPLPDPPLQGFKAGAAPMVAIHDPAGDSRWFSTSS